MNHIVGEGRIGVLRGVVGGGGGDKSSPGVGGPLLDMLLILQRELFCICHMLLGGNVYIFDDKC